MKTTPILLTCVFLSCLARAAVPDGSEFTQLRLDYASRPDAMFTWAPNDERTALLEIYKTDKKKFIDGAKAWLEKCPADIKLRVTLAGVLNELGRPSEAIAQRYIYHGLLRSIAGEVDGLSEAKAFKVIAIDEEYDLCDYLDAKVLEHRTIGRFDVLEVMWKGEKQKLYFDISIVRRNENKAFAQKK